MKNAIIYAMGGELVMLAAFGNQTLATGRADIESFLKSNKVNLTDANSKSFPWARQLATVI